MSRLFLAAVLLVFGAVGPGAQGYPDQGAAAIAFGQVIPGATVTVCAAGAVGTPCSPVTTISSNASFLSVRANPVVATVAGSHDFHAAPGNSGVSISGTGVAARNTAVTLPCVPSSACHFDALSNVDPKPSDSDTIQYVSPKGVDSNDGLSPGTAKATIGAADHALGNTNGVIVAQGVINEAGQITVGAQHTLVVLNTLKISKPILMESGARLTCNTQYGRQGSGGSGTGGIVAQAAMSEMVRGATTDGSTESIFVDHCNFDGGSQAFPNGVFYLQGLNDRTLIDHVQIEHYKGWAFRLIGVHTNSTGFMTIRDVWDRADNAANSGCVDAEATDGSVEFVKVEDYECMGATTSSAFYISGAHNWNRWWTIRNVLFAGGSSGVGLRLDGVQQYDVQGIFCNGAPGSTCVYIDNVPNTQGVTLRDIADSARSGNIVEDKLANVSVTDNRSTTAFLARYDSENPAVPPPAFLRAVGGTIRLSPSGAGSHTFRVAYPTAPVCTASDTTEPKPVRVTSSMTAVSVTGTGSDVIAWVCAPAAN